MRQTSRAVALLLVLDSAQAAIVAFQTANSYQKWTYPTAMQVQGGSANSAAGRLASRTAPYNACPAYTAAAGCAASNTSGVGNYAAFAPAKGLILTGTSCVANGSQLNITSSTCVTCLQREGVWCSRSFSFQNTGATNQSQTGTAAAASMGQIMTAATGIKDNGSCCGLKTAVNAWVAKINGAKTAAGSAANTGDPTTYNAWSCVAFSNAQTGCPSSGAKTMDGPVIDAVTKGADGSYRSWWCSNGLYLQTISAGGAGSSIFNSVQVLPDGANQRQELALVGCPQIQPACGAAAALTAIGTAATIMKIDGTLTGANKCTFVGSCKLAPPAFSIAKGATKPLDQTGGWIIHHMEYNDNQLPVGSAATFGYNSGNVNAALDVTTLVPQFTMTAAIYSKQRTWYGKGTSVYAMDNWNAPYQNGGLDANLKSTQQYGNVASFASSVAGTDYTNATTAALFDSRVVRYSPIQGFINSNAMGTTVASAYNAKKTEYDAAKTLWDNYVALLTKNAKVDAFAAAFAPPKAPTVPPLPNMPWMPSVSQTMYKTSAAKVKGGIVGGGQSVIDAALQPGTSEFWLNSDAPALASGGGWGSFTAAVLKFREGWGKSYGTIGWEKIASNTNWKAMGQVYDQSWQCATAVKGTATGACPMSYATTATAKAGTDAANVANPTTFYVAVSLWTETSSSATAYTFGTGANQSQLYLTWERGTWATAINALVMPATMAAASAASTLSGVLGAQALAASTAAALATAAALY